MSFKSIDHINQEMYLDQLYMCMFQIHINNDISFEKTWLRNFLEGCWECFLLQTEIHEAIITLKISILIRLWQEKLWLDEAIVESAGQAQCLENLQHVYIQSHFYGYCGTVPVSRWILHLKPHNRECPVESDFNIQIIYYISIISCAPWHKIQFAI